MSTKSRAKLQNAAFTLKGEVQIEIIERQACGLLQVKIHLQGATIHTSEGLLIDVLPRKQVKAASPSLSSKPVQQQSSNGKKSVLLQSDNQVSLSAVGGEVLIKLPCCIHELSYVCKGQSGHVIMDMDCPSEKHVCIKVKIYPSWVK